jgi:hypothetical protein
LAAAVAWGSAVVVADDGCSTASVVVEALVVGSAVVVVVLVVGSAVVVVLVVGSAVVVVVLVVGSAVVVDATGSAVEDVSWRLAREGVPAAALDCRAANPFPLNEMFACWKRSVRSALIVLTDTW